MLGRKILKGGDDIESVKSSGGGNISESGVVSVARIPSLSIVTVAPNCSCVPGFIDQILVGCACSCIPTLGLSSLGRGKSLANPSMTQRVNTKVHMVKNRRFIVSTVSQFICE